ncbi:MAG: YbaY family lipoprotein [Aeromicrobium sp.]
MTSDLLTITGTLTIREHITVPAGAVATVKLVDAGGEVVAATALDVTGVPAEFSLVADPALIPEPEQLFVWGALRTEVGVWGTTDLVPVDDDATEVALTRIED